ncbi:MAG: 3',5'-cyclic-nucleotide phosphodiesterase [Gammaproteobacteria bacterium]|nr:MAG: 3',5'-cyclic-nucleotide phosphodiesterase [Gammaproteobacteria bacterium]
MHLCALGCSGGIGGRLRTTCFRIDEDLLLDAGTGLGNLSLAEMRAIRHVFLTHSHLDHLAGLPLMLDSVFGELEEGLVLHALPETLEALRRHVFNWVIWPDFTRLPDPERPVLRFAPMRPGEALVLDGRRIRMIEVNHTVPAVAYCVESSTGRRLVYSGDTMTNDSLWEALNREPRIDVLVVECAFGNRDEALSRLAGHYCPRTLAEDLKKLRHDPEIYVTHLKPGAEERIFAELQALVPDRRLRCLCGDDRIRI